MQIKTKKLLHRSLNKELKNDFAKKILQNNWLNNKTAVLLIGLSIYTSFISLKNIDLFFSLTAIFIVFAYICAIITLLFIPKEWESRQNVKTLIGLGTAITIFIFAIEGLINALT